MAKLSREKAMEQFLDCMRELRLKPYNFGTTEKPGTVSFKLHELGERCERAGHLDLALSCLDTILFINHTAMIAPGLRVMASSSKGVSHDD
jgi:hypothetical protein